MVLALTLRPRIQVATPEIVDAAIATRHPRVGARGRTRGRPKAAACRRGLYVQCYTGHPGVRLGVQLHAGVRARERGLKVRLDIFCGDCGDVTVGGDLMTLSAGRVGEG